MPFDTSRIGDWDDLPFFGNPLTLLEDRLRHDPRPWLPNPARVFAALELTPLRNTRVVILGQDPYPTPGHAHGLSFSVQPDVTPLPRSLRNIFTELESDQGAHPPNGDLRFWARQGVLLLNTLLTVPEGDPMGHKSLGWQQLTREILAATSLKSTAYILWGAKAQQLAANIPTDKHLKIETPHPSPLSARRGFFGSRPFGRVNEWLAAKGHTPINWTQP
jgi:uracil-DNA glycosylase